MVIKFWIQTDRQGSLCEDSFQIDDEEWGNLSEGGKRGDVQRRGIQLS